MNHTNNNSNQYILPIDSRTIVESAWSRTKYLNLSRTLPFFLRLLENLSYDLGCYYYLLNEPKRIQLLTA